MRQSSAQHPHLARPGNVNQVRLEALQHSLNQRNVTQKRRVEAKVFFECKGEKAARQFQRPQIAVFGDRRRAVSGAHAQERQIAPPRKRLKVTTRVRHAVHFVIRVRKINHARGRGRH